VPVQLRHAELAWRARPPVHSLASLSSTSPWQGKPLSLVDGPNLIAMLKRHGRGFRIDLAEARRLEAAKA
jgi:hypothetical protein